MKLIPHHELYEMAKMSDPAARDLVMIQPADPEEGKYMKIQNLFLYDAAHVRVRNNTTAGSVLVDVFNEDYSKCMMTIPVYNWEALQIGGAYGMEPYCHIDTIKYR